MYLLKLALRPWRLALWSQAFSAVAVGMLLILVGFLFWMQQSLRPVVARLQGEQVITAYLAASVEPKDEERVVDSIRIAVGASPSTEIRLVDSKQFVAQIKEPYPDLGRELEELGQETLSVIPRYVSVTGVLEDSALERVKGVTGVDSAESSKGRYRHVIGAISALRWVARLLIVGLCMAVLTGLIHLSRMNAFLHRDALQLLKFWGAGRTTLRAPGMLSGLMVGLLGGLIALLGWLSGGAWLARQVRALSPLFRDMPIAPAEMALTLFVAGILAGLLSGALGGHAALAAPEGRR